MVRGSNPSTPRGCWIAPSLKVGSRVSDCRRAWYPSRHINQSVLSLGPEICDVLAPIAETLPVLVQPGEAWLEILRPLEAVDPGEAQIFAAAAEYGMIVVSGDKRALRALKDVEGFASELAGRIVVLEAILIALCEDLGPDEIRRRAQPLTSVDTVVKVCFSNPDSDPRDGLRSYFENLATELDPLILWNPWSRRAA